MTSAPRSRRSPPPRAGLASDTLSDEARRELTAVISAESGRLSRLVDNLLDLSRLQAGGVQPRADWIGVDEVIRAAVATVPEPPAGFDLQFDPDLPAVNADAAQLERAFANVLENAVRFAGDDPVAVRARAANRQVLIRISDHGPGIAKEDLERVFEPFLRASGEDGSGSGLGLAIARGFLEANGGRIRAESLPGQGASFVIQLPVDAAAPHAMTDEQRVLVVDDERQILRALRIILRDAGFEVATADTAEEALDALAVRPPDAAIIDLILPDGNGVDICRSIREWSEMPVIVLSAVGEEAEKVRALEAGADDYVTKPFGPDELIARLRAALRRARKGPQDEPVLSAPGLELDLAAHRVTVDGREVHLTPTEYDLLRVLMQRRGAHDPPRAAREVWGRIRGGHPGPARARGQPQAQDRGRARHAALRGDRSGRGLPLRRLRPLHDIFIPACLHVSDGRANALTGAEHRAGSPLATGLDATRDGRRRGILSSRAGEPRRSLRCRPRPRLTGSRSAAVLGGADPARRSSVRAIERLAADRGSSRSPGGPPGQLLITTDSPSTASRRRDRGRCGARAAPGGLTHGRRGHPHRARRVRRDVPRPRGARPSMSTAELFGLIVSAAGLRLPPVRAAAR